MRNLARFATLRRRGTRSVTNWDAAFPANHGASGTADFDDDVRAFVKGDPGKVGDLMSRIYGSGDLFPDDLDNAYHPYQTINYVTSHDGFCLYDLVAYNAKHNLSQRSKQQRWNRQQSELELWMGGRSGGPRGSNAVAQAANQEFLHDLDAF